MKQSDKEVKHMIIVNPNIPSVPGPWVVRPEHVRRNGISVDIIQQMDIKYDVYEILAEVHGDSEEIRMKRAKLIGAAPELLEACIWATEQFEFLAVNGKYPEHLLAKNGGTGIMDLVNAITKATK